MIAWLALCAVAAPGPAVLLDPLAATEAAERGPGPAPRRAEVLLLAGQPEAARALLPARPEDPRGLRLLADAWVAEVRAQPARAALARLEAFGGWQKHARHQRARLERRVWEKRGARLGLGFFALCLAVLGLAGARELLRLHPESVALAAAGLLAAWLARGAGPVPGLVAALLGLCWLSLGHAALSAARRIRPGPRGRLFIGTLFLFGVTGAVCAILFTVGIGPLIGALAEGAPGQSG